MTHIDEGTLQAHLDGELLLEDRWRTERHLEGCELCRRELEAQAARAAAFTAATGLLESPPEASEHGIRWPEARRGRELRRMLPRAAVLLLFVGAAASATVPGWPLREWIAQVAGTSEEAVPEVMPDQRPPSADPAPVAAESGVFVEPVGGRVEVVLRDARDLRVRTLLVGGTTAGVTTSGEATASRFRTGSGHVEVLGAAGGEVRIQIPRGATAATVIINGDVALRKEGSNLDLFTDLPGLDSAGVAFSVEQ